MILFDHGHDIGVYEALILALCRLKNGARNDITIGKRRTVRILLLRTRGIDELKTHAVRGPQRIEHEGKQNDGKHRNTRRNPEHHPDLFSDEVADLTEGDAALPFFSIHRYAYSLFECFALIIHFFRPCVNIIGANPLREKM